jgi:putative transposase
VGHLPRIDISGLFYHVMNRGALQLPIFHDDQDRQMFLRFLLQARERFPFTLHAYCLMTNHFHLLVQTINDRLCDIFQNVLRRFSTWNNLKYSRAGHSFQGRYHSIHVDKESYFKTVSAYIHLNPVRAGMVARPEDYSWSNYARLLRGEQDPLINSRLILNMFEGGRHTAAENYKAFVNQELIKPVPVTESGLIRMKSWGPPPVIAV